MNAIKVFGQHRLRPLVALDAIRRLISNKEDTVQVFRLLTALRGRSFDRNFARFRVSPLGVRVLKNKENLVDILSDRAYLQGLPQGSLGRHFLAFLDGCGITPQGLNEAASKAGTFEELLSEDEVRYARRVRVQHDLWHVIAGYGCDGFGEVCNVAFSYPHTGNIGFMVIAFAGAHNYGKRFRGEPIKAAMWEGYRRGKRAKWLPAVDWAALLPLPLAQARALVGVTDLPSHYIAAPIAIAQSRTMAPATA